MAAKKPIKKKFPYKAALVACSGCRDNQGDPCSFGCIGCGACVDKCKFGAISIGESGAAEVDEEKCIACGACVRVCPQNIIHVHECANHIIVKCSNHDKGAAARKECGVSCIGCGICAKNCPTDAIQVEDNCAVIDEQYCLSCGMCLTKCPRHVIHDTQGVLIY
ncbi:MAG: 4Fe-4S binding protein [Eubacteriaceae bacterium]